MFCIKYYSAILLIVILALGTKVAAAPDPTRLSETKACDGRSQRMDAFPRLVLWAWEKPERLGFIDVKRVGVAFLSRTCIIEGDGVAVRPRMQPLRVPPGTALMAVVRIESSRRSPPCLGAIQMDGLVRTILQAATMPGLRGIQIDFDALVSQRRFYRELLEELRSALPDYMALSITALASWCIYDDWISDLPVDEIVPMVFRMGADADRVRSHLTRAEGFPCRSCRRAVGVCTDEPWLSLPRWMRVYVFHPGAWSRESYGKVEESLAKSKMALDLRSLNLNRLRGRRILAECLWLGFKAAELEQP